MTSTTTPNHCHTLGVCQSRTPACPDCAPRLVTMYGPCTHDCSQSAACTCAVQVPADLVQAARDSGCFVPLGDLNAPWGTATPRRSGWADVAYWAAVGLATGCTMAVIFGTLGYATARGLGL